MKIRSGRTADRGDQFEVLDVVLAHPWCPVQTGLGPAEVWVEGQRRLVVGRHSQAGQQRALTHESVQQSGADTNPLDAHVDVKLFDRADQTVPGHEAEDLEGGAVGEDVMSLVLEFRAVDQRVAVEVQVEPVEGLVP